MRSDYANYFLQAQTQLGIALGGPPPRFGRPDGLPWRPDATFFLTLNLQQMVILPFNQVENDLSQAAIGEALNSDIQRIVMLSEAIAAARGRPYVSATSVTKALGELVETLATTSFQIWGPDPELIAQPT